MLRYEKMWWWGYRLTIHIEGGCWDRHRNYKLFRATWLQALRIRIKCEVPIHFLLSDWSLWTRCPNGDWCFIVTSSFEVFRRMWWASDLILFKLWRLIAVQLWDGQWWITTAHADSFFFLHFREWILLVYFHLFILLLRRLCVIRRFATSTPALGFRWLAWLLL